MKKFLLSLGLLGAAVGAHAQTVNLGPWVQVNTVNSGAFAPGYRVVHVSTVSPTVAWTTAEENSSSGVANFFFRTNNAAGDQFDFDAITAVGANASYESANISGVSATTAVVGKYGASGGGDILRTTNGGLSWTRTTTNAQFPQANGGFLDFVHMFDANVGVAVGDPVGGYFEIYRTTDGGATWNRIPQTAVLNPFTGEAALVRSYFALGNTIWFGGASLGTNDQEYVYKSTDRGITWTKSAPTPLTETISKIAFKDANNGIAYNVKVTGTDVTAVNVIRTSDGGATWQTITPVNNATGSFFRYDIDAVNGRYYSVGQRFPASSPAVAADFGSSYSTDGINWTNMNNSQGFFAMDLIPGTGTAVAQGYAGAATDAAGSGGIYKATILNSATRDAALQNALTVYPNPSNTGVFNVDLGSTLKGDAQMTVVDAMGRQVKSQAINATTVGSKAFNVDLSNEKAGVYTLQFRTEAGIATQKVVIN
ncbi:T9SS type A sorting domain-containing protein [Hymenobacter sp. 5317J-9]|uniref:T9SS type A sorting domain-containing protein n=1 Tax=Hymenobacter sp. 5317J-9 TaxID=2932250 RepID=UPI001FD6C6F8|nr:T9SS type A sorting domain-containing protein [Hymenobacter sp. 5317J-9]UOQ99788.1 T9SS type A sorting domain-containing protein [Hymenobacter sp. 5317J-9]